MNAEKKWLIKSSDTIHGPFEFDRIVENIFSGEVHLLDEIKGPFERWRPIKDHSLFAAAIEKLKASTYQPRENTMTATVDLGTQTDLTRSDTVTDNITSQDTVTKTPIVDMPVVDLPNLDQTVIYRPQPQEPQQPVQPPPHQPQITRMSAEQGQSKGRFPAIFLLSFLFLLIGGASYLVYEFQQTKLIEQKISAYDQLTDNAIDYLKTGEYQKALSNFQMAYKISPKDPNLLIEMSPLSVQFDGQFGEVEMRLESMLAGTRQKAVIKIARNIIGLSYSYREKYGEALASYDASLSVDDQFIPALLNKAFALIKLKKFEEAVALMKEVVEDNPENPATHYFYIRALLELGRLNGDKVILKETLSVADQFAQKFFDFRQEVFFLMAVARYYLDASDADLLNSVKKFLEVDLELTNLHVHDTLMDFQSFNWQDHIPLCDELSTRMDEYYKKMVSGFCLLKIRRTIEAKKIFESLLSEQNNDGLLQALYASALLKLNDISQAKNALGFLGQIELKTPVVETILRGCLVAKDLKCAQAIFKGQHFKHVSLLYSLWGNSEVEVSQDRRKAKSFLVRGLNKSPNFAPLLKLRRKL